ncbi:hypothetical protein JCM14036_35740 [Desulfotomaculum defluvii]
MAQKNWQIYLWKCSLCGSKSYGKKPPAQCSKCNSEANRHVLIPKNDQFKNPDVNDYLGIPNLNSFLYLVGSSLSGKSNVMVCSSVTQISYWPPRFGVAINKNNLSHDFIKESGYFSLAPLTKNQVNLVDFFGRNSGRQVNKLEHYNYKLVHTGSPVIEDCIGYYDCEVEHKSTVEFDSHTLFVAVVLEGNIKINETQLTYYDYQQNLKSQ